MMAAALVNQPFVDTECCSYNAFYQEMLLIERLRVAADELLRQ